MFEMPTHTQQHFSYHGFAPQRLQPLILLLLQLGEVLDGADHLAGVAVLVVVPGHDLHLIGLQTAKRFAARGSGVSTSRRVGSISTMNSECLSYLNPLVY